MWPTGSWIEGFRFFQNNDISTLSLNQALNGVGLWFVLINTVGDTDHYANP
jgi:hypothetical protein